VTEAIITLQHIPPSTNGLFANVPGKGRVRSERYRSWSNAAGWDLKRYKGPRFTGPVFLTITIGRLPLNADVSNRTKAIEDLLVEHGIIAGDTIRHVRGVNTVMADAPFDGCTVQITAAEQVAA